MDASSIISGVAFIMAVCAFVVWLEVKCYALEKEEEDDPRDSH